MKKILFCIDSLKPGGAEIIMCNTVNELVKDSNLDITVQLLQKEQKLNLDEKVKVNTFMNNNIFYRRIIKWMKDILGDSEYGLIVKNDDISIINGIKKMVTNKEFYQKYLLKVKERRTEFSVDNAVKQLKTKLEI